MHIRLRNMKYGLVHKKSNNLIKLALELTNYCGTARVLKSKICLNIKLPS